MSPEQLACVAEKLSFVTWKSAQSTIVVDLHIFLVSARRLPRTHKLVVKEALTGFLESCRVLGWIHFLMLCCWYLQEDMMARPSMPIVVQMLEGILQIPRPPPLPMRFALNTQFARILDLGGATESILEFPGIQILTESNSTFGNSRNSNFSSTDPSASPLPASPRWLNILVKMYINLKRFAGGLHNF